MKIQTLIRKAQTSTKWRGHKMRWEIYHTASRDIAIGRCKICGKIAGCDTNPLPNDIAVGGEAVALNCKTLIDAG